MTTTTEPVESTPATQLATLDAMAQAELVHRGQISPVELVEAAIERIEALNPRLNAVITMAFGQALESARTVDRSLPFAGVPFLVKDLCAEVDGMAMGEGSAYLDGYVSHGDQEYVARVRRAGFAILGKTNSPEFGMAPTAEPRTFGPTRNPWDPSRIAGGSSGGSAAAVASGMVPVAHGNDAGGSIRIPASVCGLFGLKPTRARNPLGPRYGDAFMGMVAEHVLTRTVRDSAALLDVTAGPALGDPYWAPPHEDRFVEEVGRDPGRLRIAVTRRTAGGDLPDPTCVTALDDAVELLTGLGHDVVERDLTELTPAVGSAIGRLYGAAVDWAIRYWVRELGREPGPDDLEPLTRLYWERGRQITGGELLMAQTTVQAFGRSVAVAMTEYDAWLSPTMATATPAIGHLKDPDLRVAERRSAEFVDFPLVVANLTGNPAMSLPLSWDADGLPVGVHLMGRFGDEATLLRLAGQVEATRPWAHRWAPVSAVTASKEDLR
jgi:amidase